MEAASSVAEAPGAFPDRLTLPAEVVQIAATLEEAGYETWAVGGALRDILLRAGQSDVDLATAAPPDAVLRLFRHTVPVGISHGTVGVVDRTQRLHEVTTFRRDVATDGRHAVVAFGVSLAEDLARRDFTINAIAYHPLQHRWSDPHGGLADLRAGVIRAVGDPAQRFREDFLRILRAIRFAARFGFRIDPATWTAAVAQATGLAGLSAERVRDEWVKGLLTALSIARLVRLWHDAGAAPVWLPELRPDWPAPEPPVAGRDPIVLTAVACTESPAVWRRLRGSNAELARADALTGGPEAPLDATSTAARRWLAAVGPAADDLLALAHARSGGDPPWADAVRGVRERGEATARSQLAVTGDDLIGLGFTPGPGLGGALDRLLDLVLDNPAHNTRDSLLQAARQWR